MILENCVGGLYCFILRNPIYRHIGENSRHDRAPLHLTLGQLNDLKILLEAATASEVDPDAEIFALLDQVREARKQTVSLGVRNQVRADEKG